MSSPYLKVGAICALFATAIGLTFYTLVPSEPTNDYRYNGLSQSAIPPPPPPPPAPHPETIVEEIEEVVEEVYTVVEQMPLFPGCEDVSTYAERKSCSDKKLLQYVYSNINYPAEAIQEGKAGVAVVRFKISPEGKVFGAELVRDPGMGMGEEALRTVNQMNKDIRWEPGKQGGKAVAVKFTLPVRFKLE